MRCTACAAAPRRRSAAAGARRRRPPGPCRRPPARCTPRRAAGRPARRRPSPPPAAPAAPAAPAGPAPGSGARGRVWHVPAGQAAMSDTRLAPRCSLEPPSPPRPQESHGMRAPCESLSMHACVCTKSINPGMQVGAQPCRMHASATAKDRLPKRAPCLPQDCGPLCAPPAPYGTTPSAWGAATCLVLGQGQGPQGRAPVRTPQPSAMVSTTAACARANTPLRHASSRRAVTAAGTAPATSVSVPASTAGPCVRRAARISLSL
jgi:hypothetical protein